MRDFEQEIAMRAAFIRKQLKEADADGIVYGNSGGKDSTLVGILCKKACDNTVGLIMPCSTDSNYGSDMNDAMMVADMFHIETRKVDLTKTAEAIKEALREECKLVESAEVNIPPRLRMTTLYAFAASGNRLVAGTGNKSESYMGYFTKWGDGAFDFNPIADLTVSEIYEFLAYLNAPECIINKAPSAGLYSGQTDENEMGVTYKAIDRYLQSGECNKRDMEIITRYNKASEHKRKSPASYGEAR